MIYNEEYKIKFYKDSRTGNEPARNFINSLNYKERLKIFKYIEYLRVNQGYLDEPHSKHLIGKIRELRVDFSNNCFRIMYFAFINKKIIILNAFTKKTKKTPKVEINQSIYRLNDTINNPKIYED